MMTRHDKFILDLIGDAVTEADVRHGPLTKDVVRAALILAEERGEVAKAALELTRPCFAPLVPIRRRALMNELAQVAATSILMMANLIEESDAKHE